MGLIFDGVDLELTYGVVVSGAGSWAKPERDRELVHVPGRNGDLIYDNGCWLNVEIPYSLYFRDGWLYKYEEFCEWLCSHVGYFRLEDPDRHPGVYRMAEFAGPLDPKKWLLTDDGIVTITFNCKPQQWLLDGETPIQLNGVRYVNGYFDTNRSWQEGSENGISTPLFYTSSVGNFNLIVENKSDQQKSVVVGFGKFDTASATETPSVNVNTVSIQAGGRYTAMVSPGGMRFRQSIYCEDGLDGLVMTLTNDRGEYVIDYDNMVTTVYNPTRYNANPMIEFHSQGSTLNINSFSVFAGHVYRERPGNPVDAPVYVDCELEDCYYILDGVFHNHNDSVAINNDDKRELRDFPYLKPGENYLSFAPASSLHTVIGWSGEINGINVVPRWYKI